MLQQCTMIKTTGQKLKVKLADVTRVVVNGAVQAKQIYNRALGSLLNDVKNVKCEDLIDSAVIKERFHSPVNEMFTVYPGSFDLLNVNNRKSRSTRKMLSKALTPVWHLYGHVWVRAAHMQSNCAAFVIPVASCGRLREINVGCSCDWCWCLSFFGFLRHDLSQWWYKDGCFLPVLWGNTYSFQVAPNLEIC